MTWNNGYVSDVSYPVTFYAEQSPAHLGFACMLSGHEPVALDKPFTYFELGCGHGLTSNVMAATHPHARFFASDFNPAHIVNARELAEAANLENMVFLEESFEDLAAGKITDLPQFDFVSMYGIYSWVSAANRRHIVDFLKRYLKPGGIVFINYNAMPGWSAASTLHRLARLHADLHPNGSAEQIDQARDFVERLRNTGARFFTANNSLAPYLEWFNDSDRNYRAHEYLNQDSGALYYADVVREMAGAKLDYAGSAHLFTNFPELHLTPDQRRLLETIEHGVLRETARDCILNNSMRQDVYVRGVRRLSPARLATWMGKTGLALSRPYVPGTVKFEAVGDDNEGMNLLYTSVLDALAKRPHRLSELAALPAFEGLHASALLKVASMLVEFDRVAPYFVQTAAIDPAPAHRLNMELARLSETSDEYKVLASPLLGSGTTAGLIQRLVYPFAAQLGKDLDVETIARYIDSVVEAQGAPLMRNGQPIESAEERHEEIRNTVRAIIAMRLPIWQQHGALGDCTPLLCTAE
ncbi:class I SAM-dependent methyltransferase [Noviherbaspirillum sp. CPCC 100848]|uniref:Class I SAM-dependent methyltransferase n=1 Tax=Noviherbaspirillum album TaxID=3080276 RepID=A0ABU6J3L2_9BURK|nr:class I SAM-dependent methyltransferase [Noviherbaspirillum sp. CPCC 100848]MEC4717912.1 class I SAM-dependent methyltransferase [Noviherbaspirillum sp. CPCC 100848]